MTWSSSISLHIPFMKLIALLKGKQCSINGPCVNVPANTSAVTDLIPQLPEEVQLVDFKLTYKHEYKGHHMSVEVYLKKNAALNWLKEHNPLYNNIKINYEWEQACASHELWQYLSGNMATQDDMDSVASLTGQTPHITTNLATDTVDRVELRELAEDQAAADHNAEISTQPYSSCLQLDDIEGGTFCIAPAEGTKPKYIPTDNDFEFLSFPDLLPAGISGYHAQKPRERKLDMRHYYNQRLLNCDGQFASDIEYLFSSQYATELRQVQGNIGIALRLKSGKRLHSQWLKAGML